MRYLKLLLALFVLLVVTFHVYLNMDELNLVNLFRFGTPERLLGGIQLPLYMTLTSVFCLGFIIAILFEIGVWYKYEKTIRKQRKQILGLQAALGIRHQSNEPHSASVARESINSD